MRPGDGVVSSIACVLVASLVATGLINLAVKLKEVQMDDVVLYANEGERQSTRRIRTDGVRGSIYDRNGRLLAGNRLTLSVVCDAAAYQKGSLSNTVGSILADAGRVAAVIGRGPYVGAESFPRQDKDDRPLERRGKDSASTKRVAFLREAVRRSGAVPIEMWRNLSEVELARFEEHSREYPGFSVSAEDVRVYPCEPYAAKLLGSVRNAPGETKPGEKFYLATNELRGREGLECYYDDYLRGVPGEDRVRINSLGYTTERWTVEPARKGLDLMLTLDFDIQREAERQLSGLRGACVVIDPRNGDVLAAASSSGYFLAFGGEYAPGSTFKPITALAGLDLGIPATATYECTGVIDLGGHFLRCTSRWGHGPLGVRRALMKSCNPFFCNFGCEAGTNALFAAAKAFGLGERTGVDFVLDRAGCVPSAALKERIYHREWMLDDLGSMSIGQGMLLVTPLQMARVAGAIATGSLVKPRLNRALPVEKRPLPFSAKSLRVVREGMRMVVAGDGESRGTGWRGGQDVPVEVCGKTGTAEVGRGATRRKNTWFIAYAPMTNATVAVAMVIERGESGGGTTAPKVASVLRRCFR